MFTAVFVHSVGVFSYFMEFCYAPFVYLYSWSRLQLYF